MNSHISKEMTSYTRVFLRQDTTCVDCGLQCIEVYLALAWTCLNQVTAMYASSVLSFGGFVLMLDLGN